MIAAINRMLAPLNRKIMGMVVRGVIKALKENSGGNIQAQVSLLAAESADGLELIQDYGFTSKPLLGAEGVMVFPGGDASHGLIIATADRRYRLAIADGEVAIHDNLGNKVHLKNTGEIEVVAALKVLLTSPLVEASGNLHIVGNATIDGTSTLTGAVTAGANVTAAGVVTGNTVASISPALTNLGTKINEIKTAHNTHKHQENGTGGGVTNVADVQVT